MKKDDNFYELVKKGKSKRLYIPEILEALNHFNKKNDKIAVLKHNNSTALKEILRLVYSPTVKFKLKYSEVKNIAYEDLRIDDYGMAPATLYKEYRLLKYCVDNNKNNVRPEKLKVIISQLFSSLCKEEVELVKNIFKKKLPYNGLTEALVRDVYPEFFPDKPKDKGKSSIKDKEIEDDVETKLSA